MARPTSLRLPDEVKDRLGRVSSRSEERQSALAVRLVTVAFARGEAGVVTVELLQPGHTSRQALIRDAVNALQDRWLDDLDEVAKPFDLLAGV